jgi:predicted metal-dependent HD superfamily phosphohydrolase
MNDTANRFREMWESLWAAAAAAPGCAALWGRYCEPHRHYHNGAHVVACLEEVAAWENATGSAAERAIRLAIFYHDAVYDPKATDNEGRSAALARQDLSAYVEPRDVNLITRLIAATDHRQPPATQGEAAVVDADLSILGKPQPAFDAYERAIRQEYNWVAEADFRKGRAAVLRRFLSQPHIFTTPWFRMQYEDGARVNLARSLDTLGA